MEQKDIKANGVGTYQGSNCRAVTLGCVTFRIFDIHEIYPLAPDLTPRT